MVRVGFVICASVALVASISLYAWNYDRIMRRNQFSIRLQQWAESKGDEAANSGGWHCTIDLVTGNVLTRTETCPWKVDHNLTHLVNESGENVLKKIQTRVPSGGGRLTVDAIVSNKMQSYMCYATIGSSNTTAAVVGIPEK